MTHLRIPLWNRHRRHLLAMLAFALVVLSPGTAAGSIGAESYGRGVATIEGPLAAIHDYTGGLATSWSASAEFDAGTHNGTTAQDVADTLTLARIGPPGVAAPDPATPWWDPDWNTRECFTVDHTAGIVSVTEYPIALAWSPADKVAAGLVQADYGDVRAIAADGTTELAMWFETNSRTWVQVDAIPAGGSAQFCVYYGYSAGVASPPANHGKAAVLTYSTPKPIYYTVSSAYSSGQTVAVAAYVDGTTVEKDVSTCAALDSGDRATFGGNTASSEYAVTGPIAARGIGNGLDTLIPVTWSGTRFVVPSNREDGVTSQVLSFLAPWTGATVNVFAGADPSPIGTVTVPGSGSASWVEAADEVAAGESIVIESNVPILAHHTTTNGEDATALHPVRDTTWYGMSSTAHVGADGEDATGTPTTVTITRSSSGTTTAPLFRGEELILTGTPGGGGADDGIAVRAGGGAAGAAIGALTQDDGDGRDAATFLPGSALESRYLLVTDAEYVTAVCPSGGTSLSVTEGGGATSSFSCSGGQVGHGRLTANLDVTAGRAVEVTAGSDVWIAYEDRATDDETNVLGMEQGRQYVWPAPVPSPLAPEGVLAATGSWESATFDTGAGTEVFGAIHFSGTVESGVTDLEIRVATSEADPPADFVGPDGTPASFWSIGDLPSILDFGHDGDRYLRVRVDLSTTDRMGAPPELESLTIDYHLPHADRDAGGRAVVGVTGSATPTTQYLLRVRTDSDLLDASAAGLTNVTATNVGNLAGGALRFVDSNAGLDSTQWAVAGPVDGPVGFSQAAPHSIVLDHAVAGPGTTSIDFTWNLNVAGSASILVQSDLTVEVTAP